MRETHFISRDSHERHPDIGKPNPGTFEALPSALKSHTLGGRVSKKIRHLRHEGVPQERAVATALSMGREGRLTPAGGYRRVKK